MPLNASKRSPGDRQRRNQAMSTALNKPADIGFPQFTSDALLLALVVAVHEHAFIDTRFGISSGVLTKLLRSWIPGIVFLVVHTSCSQSALADGPLVPRMEVGLFYGSSYGADSYRWMGGGNVGLAVTTRAMLYGEVGYFPGIVRQRANASADGLRQQLRYTTPILDMHAGVHYFIRRSDSRVTPYGVAGLGLLRSDFNGTGEILIPNVPPQQFPLNETSADLAFNAGSGLRYYSRERWGLRIEFKAYRPVTGPYSDVFFKGVVGIFWTAKVQR